MAQPGYGLGICRVKGIVRIVAKREVSSANYAPKDSSLTGRRINPRVPVWPEDYGEVGGHLAGIYHAVHDLGWLADVNQVVLRSIRRTETDKEIPVVIVDSRLRFRGRRHKMK